MNWSLLLTIAICYIIIRILYIEQFTLLRLPILKYYVIEEYCFCHDGKVHITIHCRSLWRHREELIRQVFLKEYILTPETASGFEQPSTPPLQPQHTITHYKTIEWSARTSLNRAIPLFMTPVHLFSLHYQIKLRYAPNHFQPIPLLGFPPLGIQNLHALLWVQPPSGMATQATAYEHPSGECTLVVFLYQAWNTDASLRVPLRQMYPL